MKRIVTIQDISCVGKCSVTVALPIISAMGVETSVLPTSILSNHTAFSGFTFKDLSDELRPIASQWEKEGISFDAVYTGYLGTTEQTEFVSEFFDRYSDGIIFVDPAMADNGSLYAGFAPSFAGEMAKLCKKADIIVPNMTEACFMLGEEYKGENYDKEYTRSMLRKLLKMGCKNAAITGVSFEKDKIGIMSYDGKNFFEYYKERINANYHGTGDVFSAACVGALMNGFDFENSLKIAVDYTTECAKATFENKNARWYGVDFETTIPYLIERIRK